MAGKPKPPSRQDITPEGVEAWVVWNGGDIGMKFGVETPACPPIQPGNGRRPVASCVFEDEMGGEVAGELWLDREHDASWYLWVIGLDEETDRSGYHEALSWCRWPDASELEVATFLISLQRSVFQRDRAAFDLSPVRVTQEFMGGVAEVLQSKDEEEE